MSETYDEEQQGSPPPRPRSRSRALVITGAVLVVAFFALTAFASFYTERLWFGSVGYTSVFSTVLWTRVGMFAVFGLLMALVVCVNVVIAFRTRPLFVSMPDQNGLDRYREAVNPIRRWLVLAVGAVLLVFAGTSGAGQWRTFMLWRNGGEFGYDDEHFGRDAGFFVFDLPWLHYLVDFAMATFVVALLAAALTHYLYGGIRLQVPSERLTGAAQAQLSVLLGLFVLAKAGDYYLDRFDLATDAGGLITGITYTDANAVLPAKNILIGISVICAVLFFLNVWRRTWTLPSVGIALLALSAVLLGIIWPGIVQQFQVNPSEADREEEYIQANIDATRTAYDLEDVQTTEYQSTATADEGNFSQVNGQVTSVPLIDPRLVRDTFEQTQQGRAYYSVAPVLDVDRYEIDGVDRALVLGVRELDQSGIPAGDRNWSNLHTTYTHGNGLIAAFANQRTATNAPVAASEDNDGGIVWAEGNQAGQDTLSNLGDEGYESRIYFGEQSPDYSVVGKAEADDADVELGLANDSETDQRTTYDGDGGVDIGNTFDQLMFAVKYGEPNFLLSGRVNENSKVLYDRNPSERVQKVAPWLTIDSDAYPALIDGRVQWIVDGYTTTDRFPGAEKESFATMIDDSLQDNVGLQPIPTDEINYMRNAVKATVDAYDGTVTLYEWDTEDPILRAWEGAFPGTVQPYDSISDELMEHLRYPEDLFKVQRYQFARYHVTEANDWYQGNDRWEVPEDPNSSSTSLQPPYRLFANQDGSTTSEGEWSLTSVFVPFERNNLASFMSVDSDATSDTYGQLSVLELQDQTTPGPGLIANEFAQDEGVRDALLPYSQGTSDPIFGNLLTLPVEDGLIYIEPVYAVRSASSSGYPILQFVLVSYGDEVGVGRSLTDALQVALGVDDTELPDPVDPGGNGGNGGNGGGNGGGEDLTVDQQIAQLLDQAQEAFDAADAALAEQDLAEYQAQNQEAQDLISQAITLAESRPGGVGGSDSSDGSDGGDTAGDEPSADASASPSESASPTS
ncbi:UPF0182 family membrane protein [Nocardioides kribbensis]|uniref:UPF0182 protein V6R90_01080 n=1 Tax=Nocardioides kribbensis TaxID=305517 RepID=A0ABV1NTM9_9ACTN